MNHLRLILGTSMGCMHTCMWGEACADFMDVLMPLACQPVQIAGRKRIWQKMVIDGIRQLSAVPSALNRLFAYRAPKLLRLRRWLGKKAAGIVPAVLWCQLEP